jgi:hypothetical protein
MGKAARVKYEATGQVDYMTNVEPTNPNVAMPGQEAYDYYGTSRGTRPGWVNRSAVMFFEPFLQFNAIDAGKEIEASTLVIIRIRLWFQTAHVGSSPAFPPARKTFTG